MALQMKLPYWSRYQKRQALLSELSGKDKNAKSYAVLTILTPNFTPYRIKLDNIKLDKNLKIRPQPLVPRNNLRPSNVKNVLTSRHYVLYAASVLIIFSESELLKAMPMDKDR